MELVLAYSINFKALLILILSATLNLFAETTNEPLNIYIDADFSNHLESSVSIERGLKVALNSNEFKLFNRNVVIIRKDHRGNSARSERNIKQYLKDPNALAIFSGIHSPPLLAHRDFINNNGVLFLVPWAAAGPITRHPSEKNSIFRLSVDDSKAGQVIVNFAIKNKKFKKPYLLLENTGWGRSNKNTMSTALENLDIKDYKIATFDWGLKDTGAKSFVIDAQKSNCDVIILVANSIEGEVISKAIASSSNPNTLPLLTHWGIIGGDFHKNVPHAIREKIDLHFIQTSFSFLKPKLSVFELEVYTKAQKLFPEIKEKKDILAPTGFIHAHDLGLLMIEAQKSIDPNNDITNIRESLRQALENLDIPIQGLIKKYDKPFSKYTSSNIDAHEALGIDDFSMAKFGENNEIILVP